MKNLVKFAGTALFTLATMTVVSAQEKDDKGKNPDSVRPIHESNVMWKQRLWRRMDLNEKQNQPFFSKSNEITKYLIEWVQSGVLQPYKGDSLRTKMTKEEFMKNMIFEGSVGTDALSDAEKAAGFGTTTAAKGGDDGWGDPAPKAAPVAGGVTPTPVSTGSGDYVFAKDISILEIKEDAIFDRQRSRLYYDIQAITMKLPASQSAAGFEKEIASFKYKDLDKLFRSNPNCIWYNAENEAQHKNMADAFDLRLHHARLIKKGNAKDKYLADIYGGERQGLLKSQELDYELMEKEHNLWEY
jgi:Gliding motility associated protein GldN